MTLPPCELVLANCCDRRFKGSMGASAPKLPRSGTSTRTSAVWALPVKLTPSSPTTGRCATRSGPWCRKILACGNRPRRTAKTGSRSSLLESWFDYSNRSCNSGLGFCRAPIHCRRSSARAINVHASPNPSTIRISKYAWFPVFPTK